MFPFTEDNAMVSVGVHEDALGEKAVCTCQMISARDFKVPVDNVSKATGVVASFALGEHVMTGEKHLSM